MEEKLNTLIFLIHDIKCKTQLRMEYKKKYEAWEKKGKNWDEYPSFVPLEPIKNEIKLARRFLLELHKELKIHE